MTHGSLFSGIGGFDLASEWAGCENVFNCEINPFSRRILNYYWPNAEQFTDIKNTNFYKYANKIDILTGGFPCQPFSVCGKGKGEDDERYLWEEMLRAIQEIKPRYVLAENVPGILHIQGGIFIEKIIASLEAEQYEILLFKIPACAVGANHIRDRIWLLAYTYGKRSQALNKRSRQKQELFRKQTSQFPNDITSQFDPKKRSSGIAREGNGLPSSLDGITVPKWKKETFIGAGNAIVPQIAYQLFKIILEYEKNYSQTK